MVAGRRATRLISSGRFASVTSLAAEDPALWAELTKAIGGTSAEFATPAAKRAKK